MALQSVAGRADWGQAVWDEHIEVTEQGARLRQRDVVRDDLGRVTSRTFECIHGPVQARKTFLLDRAECQAAELVIRMDRRASLQPGETEGQSFAVEVNGHLIEHVSTRENLSWQGKVDAYWSTGWEIVPVPTDWLRAGTNEVILRDTSGQGWWLYIDNDQLSGRSAKSIDGGQTWTSERLGDHDFCHGEYVIRLNLKRYPPRGTVTSAPIDLGTLGRETPIAPRFRIASLELEPQAETPEGTHVLLEWRSGSTPAYAPESWTAWAAAAGPLHPPADHRFLQWRAHLSTAHPAVTPTLHEVVVRATLDVVEEATSPQVVALQSATLVRPSHSFAYQLAEEPRLQILRQRWRLDQIIAGASSEYQKILRLKRWIRQQWENGWDRGELQFVPPWDALVVLELASRKLSLGMCTHYASTFVQCCNAVGLVARVVIISCHCVAEVWSNEFGKWILMDPGCDTDDGRKGTRSFERNGIPMSALDLHLAHVHRDYQGVVELNDPEPFGGSLEENIALYRQFCVTRRNNFLTSLLPEEPEHGAVAYTYDGHVWYDSTQMPLPQFSITSRREGDFHWTLNETAIHLQIGPEPQTLEVLLDTVTPNFETYLVRFNDGDWEEQGARFRWPLQPGLNTLRAKTRNRFGIEGRESVVTVSLGRMFGAR